MASSGLKQHHSRFNKSNLRDINISTNQHIKPQNISKVKFENDFNLQLKTGHQDLIAQSKLDSVSAMLQKNEDKRKKLPNYRLIKFIFDHNVLELLLFVTLRHHSAVMKFVKKGKIMLKKTTKDATTGKWRETTNEELYNTDYFAPLLAFREVMKT